MIRRQLEKRINNEPLEKRLISHNFDLKSATTFLCKMQKNFVRNSNV
jgi:hypothetical protein